jgi:hypothetical protein
MIPGIRGLKQHLAFGARRRRVVTLSHRSGDAGLALRARGRHVRVKINTPTRVWSEGGDTSSCRSCCLQERWPKEHEKEEKMSENVSEADRQENAPGPGTPEWRGTLSTCVNGLSPRGLEGTLSDSRLERGRGGVVVSSHRSGNPLRLALGARGASSRPSREKKHLRLAFPAREGVGGEYYLSDSRLGRGRVSATRKVSAARKRKNYHLALGAREGARKKGPPLALARV